VIRRSLTPSVRPQCPINSHTAQLNCVNFPDVYLE
jgi:hypothetical protein